MAFGVKKEDEFFGLLRDVATTIKEASQEYVEVFREFPDSITRIPRLKVYETNCDEQVSAVMKKLYSSFITPFDREDISALALALDDVMDYMETTAARLELFNLDGVRAEAVEMAELTVIAVNEMYDMIDHLNEFHKEGIVMEKASAISRVEDQADEVYRTALRTLFHDDELSGKMSTAWLRIFDRMEHCVNSVDHAAAVVRTVVMKSA
jgi:predicted phosphate transport protein (TIGR00153 family)